jgi:RNA-directed DNA polymerase
MSRQEEILDHQTIYRRLYLKAKSDRYYRFQNIASLIQNSDYIFSVIMDCLQHPGMKIAGIDGESSIIWQEHPELIAVFVERAIAEVYQPSPVRCVYIPKNNSKLRKIGIPTISDRMIQKSIVSALEPIYEADFLPSNFGYRPGLGTHQAVNSITAAIEQGYRYASKCDLAQFFDTVNHNILLETISQRIDDTQLLELIESLIKAEVYFDHSLHVNDAGLCQGSCLSPLLSNIYLHPLDVEVSKILQSIPGHYARYCDDFIVLTNSANEAVAIRNEIDEFLGKRLALSIEPNKSFITHVNQGVTFLGCTIIRERDHTGNWVVKQRVPKSRQAKWRQCIDDLLIGGLTQEQCVIAIKPMLMGIQAQYQLSDIDTTMRKLRARVIYPQRRQR